MREKYIFTWNNSAAEHTGSWAEKNKWQVHEKYIIVIEFKALNNHCLLTEKQMRGGYPTLIRNKTVTWILMK